MKHLGQPYAPPHASAKSPTPPPLALMDAPPVQTVPSRPIPPPISHPVNTVGQRAEKFIPDPPIVDEAEASMPWAFIALALCAITTLGLGIWVRSDIESRHVQIAQAAVEQPDSVNLVSTQPVSTQPVSTQPRNPVPSTRVTTSFAHEIDATLLPSEPSPKREDSTPGSKPRNDASPVEAAQQVATTFTEPTPVQPPHVPEKAEPTSAIASTTKVVSHEPQKESPLEDKGEAFLDEPATCDSDRKLGTSLVWAESANEASDLAQQQNKLVYLIQVSGNFEIEEFT